MRHERAILKQTCKELAKLAGRALARAMQADALGNVEMAKKEHDLSTRLETALRTYQTALDSVRVGEGAPVQPMQPMPSMQGQATPTTQPSAVQPKTAVVASAPSYTMNDILDALRDQLPATDKRPEAQQVCLAALNALQHLSSPPRFVAATSIVESFTCPAAPPPLPQAVVGWLRAKARGGARADKSE